MKKKITKQDIEKMAKEVMDALVKHEAASGCCLYYNNKKIRLLGRYHNYKWINEGYITRENVDPHEYFEYAAYKHLFSMSFEGSAVYSYYNTNLECPFLDEIFEKYGMYAELGNAWNLSCFPSYDDVEYEYTFYEFPEVEQHIGINMPSHITELDSIIDIWINLMKYHKPCGSIVTGDGIKFTYKGKPYFMSTNWNQSDSPEKVIDILKKELEFIGAENIYYDCGRLD